MSLQLVPTTLVYVSTEVMDETISIEDTMTATEIQTQINTFTATATQANLFVSQSQMTILTQRV